MKKIEHKPYKPVTALGFIPFVFSLKIVKIQVFKDDNIICEFKEKLEIQELRNLEKDNFSEQEIINYYLNKCFIDNDISAVSSMKFIIQERERYSIETFFYENI